MRKTKKLIYEKKFKKNKKYIKSLIKEEFSYKQLLFLYKSFEYFKQLNFQTISAIFEESLIELKKERKQYVLDEEFKRIFNNLSKEQIDILENSLDDEQFKKFISQFKESWISIQKDKINKKYN
jgi:hypothetical protein